jgi:type IV pilus assembly protein PilE
MKTPNRSLHPSTPGFTLVEVMVTVSIIALLAAVAIPGYTLQIRKSRRVEARLALLDFAAREERFFSTNSAYTTLPANLGYSGGFPQTDSSGYYQIGVCVADTTACAGSTASTGGAFVVQATPVGIQAQDTGCTSFSLDSTGVESGTGASASACWTN